MRAVVLTQPGGPEVLKLREVPEPEPETGEVRVRLLAAGVNPVDAKQRQRGPFLGKPPCVLGCDGAGEIVETTPEAEAAGWQAGARVWFCYGGLGQPRAGCYAEFACVPEAYLAPIPKGIDPVVAAAGPLVLITAWEALVDRARIEAGMRVAVNGAAGGVGHVAVQIAKLFECEVAAIVGSEEKARFVESLEAADCIIRRDRDDVAKAVRDWTHGEGVDVALDVVGGAGFHMMAELVRPYGDLVTLLQVPQDADFKGLRVRNVRLSQELMLTPMMLGLDAAARHQADILRRCASWMEDGQLRVHVSRCFALEEAAKAHEAVERWNTLGKIALVIAEQ